MSTTEFVSDFRSTRLPSFYFYNLRAFIFGNDDFIDKRRIWAFVSKLKEKLNTRNINNFRVETYLSSTSRYSGKRPAAGGAPGLAFSTTGGIALLTSTLQFNDIQLTVYLNEKK